MKPITLFEKFQSIIQMVQSSSFLPIIFVFVVGLAIFFFFSNRLFKDHVKKIYLCGYAFVSVLVCIRYPGAVGHVFDYVIDQLMMVLYFPNFMIVLVAFGMGSVLFLKTIFSEQTNLSKLIAIVPYSFQLFFMIMTMKVAVDQQVDLFVTEMVYQNQMVLTLFQLMIGTIGVWLFMIGFRKIYLGCVQLMETSLAMRPVMKKAEDSDYTPVSLEIGEKESTIVMNGSFMQDVQPVLNEVRPIFQQEKKPVVDTIVPRKHVQNFAQDIYQIMVENEDHLTIQDYQELRNLLVSMR